MAGRWTVNMSVAKYRLVSKPPLNYISRTHNRVRTNVAELSAAKGIFIAICLSALIWAVLLTLIF